MAGNTFWFAPAFANALGGVDGLKSINYISDEISAALLNDLYTPDQAAHESWSDVAAYEITGTGYDTGGKVLTNKTLTIDGVNIILDADNPGWNPSSLNARWVVIYKSAPELPGNRLLLGYMDLTKVLMSENGPFEIRWNTAGMLAGIAEEPV